MTARRKPPALETYLARKLVELGIGRETRSRKNPASSRADASDVAIGRELYRTRCQVCHGFDGRGRTEAGGGLYPPPIDLSRTALEKRKRTDGELFYLIRNGIRNTGMPGWSLSETQIWDLVAFLRNLPISAPSDAAETVVSAPVSRSAYVGSPTCKPCHAEIYERWIKTPMANVVRDPREHPEAVLADFSHPNPLVTFAVNDVALVYGSRWKQRYFAKVGDDYFVFPAQWDVAHRSWKPYFAKDDWWAQLYPPDNFERPTGPLCDGCHSVNYDIETKAFTEWNVGCERCHGPGGEHSKHPTSSNIVNPLRLEYVSANDVCIQCHSQGRPRTNPIAGTFYDWPVGYDVTKRLADFWNLEEHRLGETTFTHFADGTAHKNRMQGNDYVTSRMYTRNVTCFACHDAHGTPHPSSLRKEADDLCLDCHGPDSPNGPRSATLEQHTHHLRRSPGSSCTACHMPRIAQTIGDVNVRSHTFRFVTPAEGERLKIPNACTLCHADRSAAWATAALSSWATGSPWRMND